VVVEAMRGQEDKREWSLGGQLNVSLGVFYNE
jgi:hypothetical protein